MRCGKFARLHILDFETQNLSTNLTAQTQMWGNMQLHHFWWSIPDLVIHIGFRGRLCVFVIVWFIDNLYQISGNEADFYVVFLPNDMLANISIAEK
jgi:hypothetical protein